MATLEDEVQAALAALRGRATNHDRENMARFGIEAPKAFGVSMSNMQKIAKPMGRKHELAHALWETGWYEARMLACLIDDPARVTADQMDRWCADFDNWAIVDTACFKLFDQAPEAFGRVAPWARREDEFQKRAAFALLASLALHGKGDGDQPYLDGLVLIEAAALDDRNFVKKGVSWALRAIGGKRSPVLKAAALHTAHRLAASPDRAARWIGKDALRDLTRPPKPRRTPSAKTEDLP